ncbi:MAG: PH domain-containing protein [Paramuribaculum sp.]|nr:PH domain-containing protein [Paramuribaculum sp.]
MNKVYKSKVAKWYLWFCIAMTIAFIGSIYLCYKSTWVLLIDIVLIGIALIMMYDMLLHTDYTIDGATLHIRCGILYRMDLPISQISEITHKSTILSSPALSAKRIGLKYGKKNWVYVSPKNQEEFIAALSTLNPAIIIS